MNHPTLEEAEYLAEQGITLEDVNEWKRKVFGEPKQLTPEELSKREELIKWVHEVVPMDENETHEQWVDRVMKFMQKQ
jgi:hypothetical protein